MTEEHGGKMREDDMLGGVTVLSQEAKTAAKDAIALQDMALGLQVTNTTEYRNADAIRTNIKVRLKQIDDIRKAITKPLDEAKSKVMAFFRPAETALKEASDHLGGIMIKYEDAEELKRREEEARLTAEAKKQAEQATLNAAIAAEEAGDADYADAIMNEPLAPPPVRLAPAIPTVGSYTRETWSAEVYDSELLIDAVAQGKVPQPAVVPNLTFLNAQARSLKGAMNWPGVRAVCQKVKASKSG